MLPTFKDDGYATASRSRSVENRIENELGWESTREKVAFMESMLADLRSRPAANARVRELSIRSLTKRINQFKEEMIRYRSRDEAAVSK